MMKMIIYQYMKSVPLYKYRCAIFYQSIYCYVLDYFIKGAALRIISMSR